MNFTEILEKLKKLLPDKKDSTEKAFFKIVVYIIVGIVLLMIIVSLLVFFLNIDELEKTKVPDVTSNEFNSIDLISALLKIQERSLSFKIIPKYSSKYARGLVLDQRPKAGTSVKVGRTITLTVSNGPVLNQVEDYIGQDINTVRLALQEAYASGTKVLLQIEEPVEHEFSSSVPVNHVIDQFPIAGTELVENKIIYLKLKVSMGPESTKIKADNYLGLDFQAVMARLFSENVLFTIEEETEKNSNQPGTISTQSVKPGDELKPDAPLLLKYNKPTKLEEDMVYGQFDFIVREYDVAVPIRLDLVSSEGTKVLYSFKNKGGPVAIPYILPNNSELILYVIDKLVEKQIVQKSE